MKGRTKIVPLRTPEEVVATMERCGFVEFTATAPNGYDTERGYWSAFEWLPERPTQDFKLKVVRSMMTESKCLFREIVRYSADEESLTDRYEAKIRKLEDESFIKTCAIIILLVLVIFMPLIGGQTGICTFN